MRTLIAALAPTLTAPFALAQTFVLSEGIEARFLIDEVLLGRDKPVIGATPGVKGDLTLLLNLVLLVGETPFGRHRKRPMRPRAFVEGSHRDPGSP